MTARSLHLRREPVEPTRLTPERVLLSAVDLADKGGLGALTMRALGDELRVEAMSLYNHVANKEDMLGGMVDLVFAEIGVPPSGADWKEVMRERALAARAALARHPWAIALMESRRRPGPTTLRHHDAVIGCLRDAGFSVAMAGHVYSLLDSYIYGFALQQTNMPFRKQGEDPALEKGILQQTTAGAYPHLTQLLTEVALQPGYDYASEFEFGLDVILDAIDRLRAGGQKATGVLTFVRSTTGGAGPGPQRPARQPTAGSSVATRTRPRHETRATRRSSVTRTR